MASFARSLIQGFNTLDEIVEAMSWVWTGLLILGIGSLAYLAMDREPPFSVVQVYPASARPGEQVEIVAKVRRDLDRQCASDMSRFVFDGRGTRWDEPTRHFSPDTIAMMARQNPDTLRVSVTVPKDAYPGQGSVVSDLEYHCNVTHAFWPIRITAVMPFTILP